MISLRTWLAAATTAALLLIGLAPVDARGGDPVTAADAIRAAIVERLGAKVEVSVTSIDLTSDGPVFREARPDPSARLGRPMRFTLITQEGDTLLATAVLTVTADHVVTRRPIARGATVDAADVAVVRGELTGVPLKRLPALESVVGAKALRPVDAGTVVLPGFVLAPRAVEPGDTVTVTAAVGAIEVSATMLAVDGGRIGDTIRVRHPEGRTYLRARILRAGYLEVIHGR